MKKVAEQIKVRCSGEGSQKKFKTDTTSEKSSGRMIKLGYDDDHVLYLCTIKQVVL